MLVMDHPRKVPRAYDVADLRDKLERTRKLIPLIEDLLTDAEAAYGKELNGLLAGVGRVWSDIQGVKKELGKLVDNAPASGGKKRKG